MFERMKENFEIERSRFARIRRTERASQLRPWPLEQSGVRIGQETLERPINLRIAKIKGRLQVVHDLLADVFGQVDGEHVLSRTSVIVVGARLNWLRTFDQPMRREISTVSFQLQSAARASVAVTIWGNFNS